MINRKLEDQIISYVHGELPVEDSFKIEALIAASNEAYAVYRQHLQIRQAIKGLGEVVVPELSIQDIQRRLNSAPARQFNFWGSVAPTMAFAAVFLIGAFGSPFVKRLLNRSSVPVSGDVVAMNQPLVSGVHIPSISAETVPPLAKISASSGNPPATEKNRSIVAVNRHPSRSASDEGTPADSTRLVAMNTGESLTSVPAPSRSVEATLIPNQGFANLTSRHAVGRRPDPKMLVGLKNYLLNQPATTPDPATEKGSDLMAATSSSTANRVVLVNNQESGQDGLSLATEAKSTADVPITQ